MSGEEASADDKPNFGGKYVLVRNNNLDQFLAANGTSNEVVMKSYLVGVALTMEITKF